MAKLRECPQGRNLFSAPIDLFVGLLSLFFVKATKLLFLLMGGRVDVKAGKNTFLVLGMERARVASEIDTLFGTISRSCSEFLLRDKLGLQTETIQKLIFRKGPIFSLFEHLEPSAITEFLLFKPNLGLYYYCCSFVYCPITTGKVAGNFRC